MVKNPIFFMFLGVALAIWLTNRNFPSLRATDRRTVVGFEEKIEFHMHKVLIFKPSGRSLWVVLDAELEGAIKKVRN